MKVLYEKGSLTIQVDWNEHPLVIEPSEGSTTLYTFRGFSKQEIEETIRSLQQLLVELED